MFWQITVSGIHRFYLHKVRETAAVALCLDRDKGRALQIFHVTQAFCSGFFWEISEGLLVRAQPKV